MSKTTFQEPSNTSGTYLQQEQEMLKENELKKNTSEISQPQLSIVAMQ